MTVPEPQDETALRERIRLNPADRAAWHGLIGLAVESGQTAAAQALAARMAVMGWQAEDAPVLCALARLLTSGGAAAEAEALTNDFLKQCPNQPIIIAMRGRIKLAQGDGPAAMADLTPAWQARRDPELVYSYALAARLSGATQPAAQAFAWAARAAPANAGYQHAAGLYSLETGQYQEAAFWAQRAAALDPASDYLDLLAVATAAHSLQRRTSIYRNP